MANSTWAKEQDECRRKINEYSLAAEANIVASLFVEPELLYDLDLDIKEFGNNIWRCWYAVASELVLNENKHVLDELTVGIYLDKHLKLKDKIETYGGFGTIQDATSYISTENFSGYVTEIKKWNVVRKLLDYGFPVATKLSEYADSSIDDIYKELESILNHTFANAENDIVSYNVFDNMHEFIDELNAGSEIGVPFANADILNRECGGMHMGTITGIGGLSGTGKSLLAILYLLPTAIKYNVPVVVLANEEGIARIRRESLCYILNNVLNKNVNKYQLRNGNFGPKLMADLQEAADYLETLKEKHLVTMVPLQRYTCNIAIKFIKKYAKMGCSLFLLDTMKPSADAKGEIYQNMMDDSVALYDAVKENGLNVHLLVTYQLNKGSSKMRKYTNDNIGWAKSIVDIMSLNLMIRRPFVDEYADGTHALKCFRIEDGHKIPFALEEGKSYILLTITKNRYGEANNYEIVAELDYGRNIYREIGVTRVPEDF